MFLTEQLTQVGEHSFLFSGAVGSLEALLTIPPAMHSSYIALLGHPHSLQGGSMHNKVVTTMVRAFKELGIPSLRFNFRGVGQSAGFYDAGLGESEDMLVLMQLWQEIKPTARFLFAGFSFGSYVAYRAAALSQQGMLITIAPPVHHYNYQEFASTPKPWLIMQGEADEIVPLSLVLDFAKKCTPAPRISCFAETTHFFHGKLLELKAQLIHELRSAGLEL